MVLHPHDHLHPLKRSQRNHGERSGGLLADHLGPRHFRDCVAWLELEWYVYSREMLRVPDVVVILKRDKQVHYRWLVSINYVLCSAQNGWGDGSI